MRSPFEAQCHHDSLGIVPNLMCAGGNWILNPDSLAGLHHPIPDLVWSHSQGKPQCCSV